MTSRIKRGLVRLIVEPSKRVVSEDSSAVAGPYTESRHTSHVNKPRQTRLLLSWADRGFPAHREQKELGSSTTLAVGPARRVLLHVAVDHLWPLLTLHKQGTQKKTSHSCSLIQRSFNDFYPT